MIDLEYSTFEIPPKKKKIFKAIFWDGNHVYILKSKSLVIFVIIMIDLLVIFTIKYFYDHLLIHGSRIFFQGGSTVKFAWGGGVIL